MIYKHRNERDSLLAEFKLKAFIHHLKWVVDVTFVDFKHREIEVDLTNGQGDTSEYSFDDVTLLPYIQKNDRQGKEIYLGDIVSLIGETTEGFYRKDFFEVIWDVKNLSYALLREDTIYNDPNMFDLCTHEGTKFEKTESLSITIESDYTQTPGFKITCLNCGSDDCEMTEDIDYDYEENPFSWGSYIYCNKCGNDNR